MNLRPITIMEAREVCGRLHRHNEPPDPRCCRFAVAAEEGGEIVGVAIIGHPQARLLTDGWSAEVLRVATDGTRNACSLLYGAATRAAKALGFRRIYTYTLAEEPGTSLKASGWTHDADLKARKTWSSPARHRYQKDLFGNDKRPTGPKVRWVKELAP